MKWDQKARMIAPKDRNKRNEGIRKGNKNRRGE